MAALRKFMCESYLFYVDFAAAADGRRGFRPMLPQGARGVKARAKRKRGVCGTKFNLNARPAKLTGGQSLCKNVTKRFAFRDFF